MNRYKITRNFRYSVFYKQLLVTIFVTGFLPASFSQQQAAVKGEMAVCRASLIMGTVNPQTKAAGASGERKRAYEVRPRQTGYFDVISNISPEQMVSLQINYPGGRTGEKGVVIVADGGTLAEGKKVQQMQLDDQNNFSFDFRVAKDPGLYRLVVRKGDDLKVVQLWVGADNVR